MYIIEVILSGQLKRQCTLSNLALTNVIVVYMGDIMRENNRYALMSVSFIYRNCI